MVRSTSQLDPRRGLFAPGQGVASAEGDVPTVPLVTEAPEGWRRYACESGLYTRFSLRYPRSWHALPAGGDTVHLVPDDREGSSLALTISSQPGLVSGPQGILDAFEALAEQVEGFGRSRVALDRWGEDSWAGSWAWSEVDKSGDRVAVWLLVLGNDQGFVFAMSQGDPQELAQRLRLCAQILGTVRLPDAELLSPEHFPRALADLLNDRAAVSGELPWDFNDEGDLSSGPLVARLPNLYRLYLSHGGDLDRVAWALDSRPREAVDQHEGAAFADIADRLRAVLRRSEVVGPLDIVQIAVGDGVMACPVLDDGDRVTYIPRAACAAWGVDEGAILREAIERLDAEDSIPIVEMYDEQTERLVGFQLAARDGFDSGRLLCPSLRAVFEASLGSPLLVCMPQTSTIRVCRDDEASRRLLAPSVVGALEQKARPLSDQLWLWSEEGLIPLDLH